MISLDLDDAGLGRAAGSAASFEFCGQLAQPLFGECDAGDGGDGLAPPPLDLASYPDDPITGSKKALEALGNAASGGGKIKEMNYDFVPIASRHLPPDQIPLDRYPWGFKGEAAEVREALRKVLKKAGLPTRRSANV